MSAAFVDAVANAVLDSLLGTTGILPGTVYVGLLLGPPASNGTGVTEPVGGSYARQASVNNGTNWPAASARLKTHAFDITFPVATGNWGLITHVGIFDAISAGNLKLFGALAIPRNIVTTDQFRFLAGTSPLALSLPSL